MAEDGLPLSGWAVVLGASSGFGAACSLALAKAGMDIVGVHLDRRTTIKLAEDVQAQIRALGREALFFNINAADDAARAEVLAEVTKTLEKKGQAGTVRVLLHSLAFGALKPMIGPDTLSRAQLEMTIDVMANSLVYWTHDLVEQKLMGRNGRIYAMTSSGSLHIWAGYGAVSGAKSALESHVRQLAFELAPLGITANAIRAGVTETPAMRKIPASDGIVAVALRKNPNKRLTTPQDVASCLVALARPETYWLTGNVLNIDGGEEDRQLSAPLRERHARPGKVPKLAEAELEAGLAEIPQWRLAPVAQAASPVTPAPALEQKPSPVAKGVPPVAPAPVLAQSIQRQLKFKDFVELMRFVNRMADMAQAENHHPDFSVHYNQLDITLWTHDAGGLTENDLIVAARIDGLLSGS